MLGITDVKMAEAIAVELSHCLYQIDEGNRIRFSVPIITNALVVNVRQRLTKLFPATPETRARVPRELWDVTWRDCGALLPAIARFMNVTPTGTMEEELRAAGILEPVQELEEE